MPREVYITDGDREAGSELVRRAVQDERHRCEQIALHFMRVAHSPVLYAQAECFLAKIRLGTKIHQR